MVSEHCVACRIMTLGLETTKENFQQLPHLSFSSRKLFESSFSSLFVDELHQRSHKKGTTHDNDFGV